MDQHNYKFNIGDLVQVLDPGETWPMYKELFIELGFTNTTSNDCDDYPKEVLKNCQWKVFNRTTHDIADGIYKDSGAFKMYGIQTEINNNPVQLLIDEVALQSIAWPRSKAVIQCKELMNKLIEIINIYNLTEEDFKTEI